MEKQKYKFASVVIKYWGDDEDVDAVIALCSQEELGFEDDDEYDSQIDYYCENYEGFLDLLNELKITRKQDSKFDFQVVKLLGLYEEL